MKLSIGFSPCPNDTFIFDALVNGKISTGDLQFEPILEDVETLNKWAGEGRLDITKLSFPAFFGSADTYTMLDSGSAMGKGLGPLLIAGPGKQVRPEDIENMSIAIPGVHTTANLLLGYAFPAAGKKIPMVFSSIEEAVLSGKTDLGVIIHENRFTYSQKGLTKVLDLGEYWEEHMHIPIPLGGIFMKRNTGREICLQVERLIRESIDFAFLHYPAIAPFVKIHSQTMSEDIMRRHIDLYVNDFSRSLGLQGKAAVRKLQQVYHLLHGGGMADDIFLEGN